MSYSEYIKHNTIFFYRIEHILLQSTVLKMNTKVHMRSKKK